MKEFAGSPPFRVVADQYRTGAGMRTQWVVRDVNDWIVASFSAHSGPFMRAAVKALNESLGVSGRKA